MEVSSRGACRAGMNVAVRVHVGSRCSCGHFKRTGDIAPRVPRFGIVLTLESGRARHGGGRRALPPSRESERHTMWNRLKRLGTAYWGHHDRISRANSRGLWLECRASAWNSRGWRYPRLAFGRRKAGTRQQIASPGRHQPRQMNHGVSACAFATRPAPHGHPRRRDPRDRPPDRRDC